MPLHSRSSPTWTSRVLPSTLLSVLLAGDAAKKRKKGTLLRNVVFAHAHVTTLGREWPEWSEHCAPMAVSVLWLFSGCLSRKPPCEVHIDGPFFWLPAGVVLTNMQNTERAHQSYRSVRPIYHTAMLTKKADTPNAMPERLNRGRIGHMSRSTHNQTGPTPTYHRGASGLRRQHFSRQGPMVRPPERNEFVCSVITAFPIVACWVETVLIFLGEQMCAAFSV